MDTSKYNPAMLAQALENVRKAADQVRRCPACQSDQVYTVLNTIYYFDHPNREFSFNSSLNLAEHGWHGCRRCDHKWVSNAMLQTALPPKTQRAHKSNVIDLTRHKKKFN